MSEATEPGRDPNEDFYYDDASEPDEPACPHCRGDGMDPDVDYLLPCPVCGEVGG